MKLAIALATALLPSMVSAAPPASVEYFPAPALSGHAAPFSSAVRVGDILYLSGQIGLGPDGKLADSFDAQARQTMDNIGATLKAHGLGWGNVFKCTVMIADMKNWPAFNAIYVPYFPNGKLPVRSAFGANGLALGAQLELECLAYTRSN
jgi:2-iminobutanoate/2-iminopropanoate deaminase